MCMQNSTSISVYKLTLVNFRVQQPTLNVIIVVLSEGIRIIRRTRGQNLITKRLVRIVIIEDPLGGRRRESEDGRGMDFGYGI
jgi:hypothetical protein